uniref:Kindlin-2 N-terminal domain-containing protein n=1 Tax=Cyprinus carpio TaxID=7962 RepID=A0A8C1VCY4_CYPCA
MATAAEYGHNSWELSVQVDQREGDEGMKFKLRVKGDLHVGGLMLKLVEKISEYLQSSFCDKKCICSCY